MGWTLSLGGIVRGGVSQRALQFYRRGWSVSQRSKGGLVNFIFPGADRWPFSWPPADPEATPGRPCRGPLMGMLLPAVGPRRLEHQGFFLLFLPQAVFRSPSAGRPDHRQLSVTAARCSGRGVQPGVPLSPAGGGRDGGSRPRYLNTQAFTSPGPTEASIRREEGWQTPELVTGRTQE